jgi:hypothetical protein
MWWNLGVVRVRVRMEMARREGKLGMVGREMRGINMGIGMRIRMRMSMTVRVRDRETRIGTREMKYEDEVMEER